MTSLIPSNIVMPEIHIDTYIDTDIDTYSNVSSLDNLTNLTNLTNLPILPILESNIFQPASHIKYVKPIGVSLCLNMIVRNESKIITRLLQSVLPIIDTYLICDTGSTDDTISIIKNFFDSWGILGEVITEPFKNFGYNRTVALKAAYGKATYALLLDADMIFKIEPSFNKQALIADSYLITQKGGGLSYYNTRLIKLNIDAKSTGPTHEYYDMPPGSRNERLDTIWIDDIGDGGSKGDKFNRDIRLLKQGIKEEPNNGRYYFYLANSYFNSAQHQESIPYYIKRIEIGGWYEEVFYSHLNLGHAYMKGGKDEMAISIWMNGYNHHSGRSETLYEICKYYREKGKTKLAMAFCMLGKAIPYPKNDTLFIHNDVYETGFDYELSIIGYYNNYPNIHKVIYKLMNHKKQHYNNLLSNYKFYCPKISEFIIQKIGGSIMKEKINVCGQIYEMNGSNPCIFKYSTQNGSGYMLNIRFVNYLLNKNGTYHFAVNDGKIVTVNKIYKLDNNLKILENAVQSFIPDSNTLRYVGMEDMKPFETTNSTLLFIGTCENPINNHISIGYGRLNMNLDSNNNHSNNNHSNNNHSNNNHNNNNHNNNKLNILQYNVVNSSFNKDCEKNWVFYKDTNGNTNVIYQWYPLMIGNIKDTNTDSTIDSIIYTDDMKKASSLLLNIIQTKEMPAFFQNARGSSNGFEYKDEIWFLCHVVEYNQPREYYHFFAVFNKQTMDILRWSHLFKFEGEKIEYALGLIVEDNRIIISYSKWDSEPTIGIFNKTKIDSQMF